MAKGQKYHCGAEKWPKWVRRIASLYFNSACKIHDLDYGERTPFTQKEADDRFKAHMDILTSKYKYHRLLKIKARLYYWGVSKYGKKQYAGDEVAIMAVRNEELSNKKAA